jgi:multiple sugar transport system substrate-binding protein
LALGLKPTPASIAGGARLSCTGTRRRALGLSAFAAICVVAAACGGGSSSSTSTGAGGGGARANAGTTLTWWATNQAPKIDLDNQILRGAVARFKRESGVTVNFKVVPWGDLFTNITTAVTSGRGPDVLNIGNTWSASLQATGAFVPFEGDALSAIGGKDRFLPTAWSATGASGKTPTSVPLYGLSYVLFYNKKLFRQAGIAAPPKTWSEFVADAKKLTKDTNGDGTPDQWGVTLEGANIATNSHAAFIFGRQNGGSLFGSDGKPTFTAPGEVKAVQDFVGLMSTDKVVSPSNAQFGDGSQAVAQFASGKAGMFMWQINAQTGFTADGMKPSQYGVAEMPVADGTKTPIMTMVAGTNVSVFQHSKHRDAALQFVKFLTSAPEQVALNKAYQSLPVVGEAAKDPTFAAPIEKVANSILANNAAPMPQVAQEGQMETLIGGAIKQLFAQAATKGSVTPADVRSALADANQKMAAVGG